MNKNEFYKQLMSEYTFDTDKIRENAKRGKSSRQKLSPIYIGMSAAAAVCVVTVGTIAAVNLGKQGGVSLTDSGLTQLSASDRLSNALQQLELERGSTESKDFLVTFSAPLTPAQAQAVLTGYSDGNVPVKQLYFSDGTKISGSDNIGRVFSGGSYEITGAAIYCSGDTAARMQNDPSVFLVETMEGSDFDNSTPVNIAELQDPETTPAVPDNPVTLPEDIPVNPESVSTPDTSDVPDDVSEPDDTEDTGISDDDPQVISDPDPAETDQTGEDPNSIPEYDDIIEPDIPDSTTDGSVSEPDLPDVPFVPDEPDVPVVPDVQPQDHTLPDGITLPTNTEPYSVNTYIYADSSFFLTNDIFFVKTGSEVALYRFENGSESLICSEEISDAKIAWVDENGGRLMVTGISSYETRGRTLLVDAEIGSIIDLSTEDAVMSGSLVSASYNEDSSFLVLNIREDGTYYVCTYRISSGGSSEYIGTVYESSLRTAAVASKDDTIYLAQTDKGVTTLLAVDAVNGGSRTVHQFDSEPNLNRNLAFTHAVFTTDDVTLIFDPQTEKLIPVISSGSSVTFGASRHSFMDDGSCYTVSGGSLIPSGGISTLSAIEYKKSFSQNYAATVSSGCVKITRSVYSAVNRSVMLTFSDISESAPAEFRKALNGAIGINNVLALKKCSASGIYSPQTLKDCISVYYSENTTQKLMTKCEISMIGVLRYETGGLSAVSADDTALVISSQTDSAANGVLYVKAGSFGGRTAYRSINVSFVKENGTWKLDTIL